MITCTILCILLGVYSASSIKTDVTLNLCKINEAQFRKESQSSPNYNEYLFFPKDQYNVVEVIDSGIDVWKKTEGSTLASVDVYYKEFIPQLVVLNINKSSEVSQTYFKRDKGKFTEITKEEFKELANSNDFLDKTLKLDLQRGFSNKYFILSKMPIDNIPFDQYELKYELNLLKFTNGRETMVDGSRDELLVRMLRLKLNQRQVLLQIIKKNELLTESSFYYEFSDTNWKVLNAVEFKQLCSSITSSNDSRVESNDAYGSDDEAGYEFDETEISEAGEPRRNSETISEIVSPEVEEPATLGDVVNKAIAKNLKSKQLEIENCRGNIGETTGDGEADAMGYINPAGIDPVVEPIPEHTRGFGIRGVPPSRRPSVSSFDADTILLDDGEGMMDAPEDEVFENFSGATASGKEAKKRKKGLVESEEEEEASMKNVYTRSMSPPGEYAPTRSLVDLLGNEFKSRLKQARQELEEDDLEKSLQQMEGTVKVLETGFSFTRFGKVEDSDENECEGTEDGMKEVRPHGPREEREEDSTVPPVSPVSHHSHHSHQSHHPHSRHPSQGSHHSEGLERPTTPQSTHSHKSHASHHSQASNGSQPGDLTLFLDGGDDTYAFTITKNVNDNGIVEKIYKPKKHRLIAVKNTLPLWVADLNEVRCTEVTVHTYNEDLEAVKLNIALQNGFTTLRYYNPLRFTEIMKEEYEELLENLVKKATDPRSKEIELVLDYVGQRHIDVTEVESQYTVPYKKYRPESGYRITRVLLGNRQVWRGDERYPYADSVTYYTHFNKPAYLVLNIPEANYFIKTVTIDLVKGEKVAELTEEQLGYLLDRSLLYQHTLFDLSEPINNEEYLVEKTDYRGFIIRNFTKVDRRVTMVLDNKVRVTPTNIIPFTDFKVYYYRNLPVMLLTDPFTDPNYFARLDLGWEPTTLSKLTEDLDLIKQNLSDPELHPRTFVGLNYELEHNEGFLVESGVQNGLHYKRFLPVLGNIVVSIYCREGFVLSEEEKRTSAGAKFYLRNKRPYKAELLINSRRGLKKYVFKVFEAESGRWTQVDESLFENY